MRDAESSDQHRDRARRVPDFDSRVLSLEDMLEEIVGDIRDEITMETRKSPYSASPRAKFREVNGSVKRRSG